MIAAGLCMMGGCFAQDAGSQAVETYWPAHSVYVDKSVVIKDYAYDLTTPFWRTEGLRAGARVENVIWTEKGNILSWGNWVTGFADALYMGTAGAWDKAAEGAVAYGVGESGETAQVAFSLNSPLDFIEVAISNLNFTLSCSAGSKTAKVDSVGTAESRTWRIGIRAEKQAYNLVSYYWEDAVRKLFFAVQPMCAVNGFSAFYTHGYNILTEI